MRELFGADVRSCAGPFSQGAQSSFTELETLPYHGLEGSGLERLCYQLLLSRGYEPRFFGRSGQPQYGIDLVAEKGDRTEVYQCKNLATRPSSMKLQSYLDTFERDWLCNAHLPRPNRFVICCPTLLRDTEVDTKWILAKTSFAQRTGVEAGLWHLDLLNEWLKNLPDVVADLFSDRHAQAFCNVADWNPDLFLPVHRGASGDRRLNRYFDSLLKGRLYFDEDRARRIMVALEHSPVIVIRGLPGTGKTFTALSVAENLKGAQERVYFVDASRDECTKVHLREGIRSRLSRPSAFVLDNCHENLASVVQALEDLGPLLAARRSAIICLMRRVPGTLQSRGDDSQFFSELESESAAVDLNNDDTLLKRVVEFWRPTFAGLSESRLSRLTALCGKDLYFLDELLRLLTSPTDIDELDAAAMYNAVRRAYLGSKTADEFLQTRRLATLAQFEIHARADILRPSSDELSLLEGLYVRAGQPPRWHFLHSTAAELIVHVLWSGMGVVDPADVAREAARDLTEYFVAILDPNLRPRYTASSIEADLLRVLTNPLRLMGDNEARCLKAAVLDSEIVTQLPNALSPLPTYPTTIQLCALVAHESGARSSRVYAQLLSDALAVLISRANQQQLHHCFPFIGSMLHTLETIAPELHAQLTEQLNAPQILALIDANATLHELFKIIEHAPSALASELVLSLNDERLERLMERTIAAGRSATTLHLTLRHLLRSPDTARIGLELERRVGVSRLLKLIESQLTIVELCSVVSHASPAFAQDVVDALDNATVERLIGKTAAAGRSIATLHLSFRALRRQRETAGIGELLEQKIGVAGILRLIETNGSMYELFRIVQHTSGGFARLLVTALDERLIAHLSQKTIDADRSIGTLDLALRELRLHRTTMELGYALARKVSAEQFRRLIESNGTIYELFRIIGCLPTDLALRLIELIDDSRMSRLVDKTIASGRSIGTLTLTLSELRRTQGAEDIAQALENKVGTAGFWKLIIETGSPGPLVDLVRYVSPESSPKLVVSAAGVSELQWKRILARGDLFQLCELIADCQAIFHPSAGGEALVAAIEDQSPDLVRRATWYQRRSGNLQLGRSPESPSSVAVSRAISAALADVDYRVLRFSSLHEAVNGLELLYDARPDVRSLLAAQLRTMLPASEHWVLDPRQDMAVPRILLRLLAKPEISDEDAGQFADALTRCLKPETIEKSRTVDILWTLWAMFAHARRRSGIDAVAFGRTLPSEFVRSLHRVLVVRTAWKDQLDEVRSRFALVGLLALLGLRADATVLAGLRKDLDLHGEAGVWRLCTNQKFVAAWLVLRAIEIWDPNITGQREEFQRRLLGAAEDYVEMDPAADLLYQTTLTQTSGLQTVGASLTVGLLERALADSNFETLRFRSLSEGARGVELLYQSRPEARPLLAARLRELLPPPELWVFDPRDLTGPRTLLMLLAKPEVSDADMRYFADSIANLLTWHVLKKCRAEDILWTVWAMFALARSRSEMDAAAIGSTLPGEFIRLLQGVLAVRAPSDVRLHEVRAIFALVGLLMLLGFTPTSNVVNALRGKLAPHDDAGAWWLCANETFVKAWLILHALEIVQPLPRTQRTAFRRRLLSAADEEPDMDAAARYLQAMLPAR